MLLFEQGGNLRVRIGLVPQGPREMGLGFPTTGHAECPIGIQDLRPFAGTIVPHHLKFESTRRLVVTDHLEDLGLFLIAEKQPVFEEHAG